VVTDPSAELSRMHLCVRILWVAVINPGLIYQFTHLAASLQDRLNCLLHSSHLSDSTQGNKLPPEFQTIINSISLNSKDSPYINTSLNEQNDLHCSGWVLALVSTVIHDSESRGISLFHDSGSRAMTLSGF
jgi:hypothetical protein